MEPCGHCGSLNCAYQGVVRGLTRCLHTSRLRAVPKALGEMNRSELDAEAERLGIEIEPKWRKGDLVAAIERAA